jgi:hypothetical protein
MFLVMSTCRGIIGLSTVLRKLQENLVPPVYSIKQSTILSQAMECLLQQLV